MTTYIPVIFECCFHDQQAPSGVKKHRESTVLKQKVTKWPKSAFFLFQMG